MTDQTPDLGEFEAEFTEPTIESDMEALHLFFGTTHVLHALALDDVVDVARTEFDWVPWMWDEPRTFWEWVLSEEDEMQLGRITDAMADFVKFTVPLISDRLVNSGIPRLELYVFLPCHGSFHRLSWSTEHEGFVIR
jgi:hypothetical protein